MCCRYLNAALLPDKLAFRGQILAIHLLLLLSLISFTIVLALVLVPVLVL